MPSAHETAGGHSSPGTPPAVLEAIRRFQAGEDPDGSFKVVFEHYVRPIGRFFARKGIAPELRHDLTQESLLGIYQGLEAYRPDARFETWIYTICTNAFRKHLRAGRTDKRRGVEVPADEELGLEAGGGQLDSMLDDEQRRTLRGAVGELPEQMRRCLTLRIYQGLSYRDIATLTRTSVDTVKSHLLQGRRRLRTRLAEGRAGGARP